MDARTWEYVTCGALQVLVYLGYCVLAGWLAVVGYVWVFPEAGPGNHDWLGHGMSLLEVYLRSIVFAGATFVLLCILPVAAKWMIIGRFRPREIRIWSLAYFRFWLVKTLMRTSPMVLLNGSPLTTFYLRAMGAKVGRNVTIMTKRLPVCTDLLTIGEGTVVRKDVIASGYRAHGGVIQFGAVTLGRDVVVGEGSILDINTVMGDGSQLGHRSSLYAGQAVPADERWHGTPGRRTDVDFRTVDATPYRPWRRGWFACTQFLSAVGLGRAMLTIAIALVVLAFPRVAALLEPQPLAFTDWSFYAHAVGLAGLTVFGGTVAALVLVTTVPRLLNLALKPDTVYPLFGLRDGAARAVTRLTNNAMLGGLFGDSSYVVNYLRAIGYDLGQVQQTGSNMGTVFKHDNPFLSSIGTGTMIADAVSFMNADYSPTSFKVSRATIGAHNFLGNGVFYPAGARTGDNCLLATMVAVPIDGPVRHDVGLLGSPPFEIPRSVLRDALPEEHTHRAHFRRDLAAKNRHNLRTMALLMLVRWLNISLAMVIMFAALELSDQLGFLALSAAFVVELVVGLLVPIGIEHIVTRSRATSAPALLHLQPILLVARAVLEAADPEPVHDHPRRDAVQAVGLASARRADRVPGLRRRLRVPRAEPGDDRLPLHTERRLRGAVPFPGRRNVQDRPQHPWGRRHARRRLPGPLRRDGRRRCHRHHRLLRDEGDDPPPGNRVGRQPGRRGPSRRHVPSRAGKVPIMTTTSALTCRTAANRSSGPGKDRTAPAGAAPTAVPRWTQERQSGQGRIEVAVPENLRQAVRTLSQSLQVPPGSIWLAAHARVLQSLSGETEVTTGCKDASGTWPCELDLRPGSWHALVSSARTRQVQAHAERAGGPQAGRPPASGTYEVVLSTDHDEDAELAEGLVLGVSLRGAAGGEALSLRYRRDVLDEDAALRIAGYHLSAVRHLVADPESDPDDVDLVGPEERRLQLEQLAGPERPRPQRRFHELFEERVRQHPERIAAVQDAREWTYLELNARANRVARALLARGLRAEDIVAVVAERDLEWMAAVIGILKAGGAYLPIEPHFPADRIARTLTRAGARTVLTEGGSTTTLDEALEGMPAVTKLLFEDIEAEGHPADDPGLEIRPDQLAYVYFTSGSTGEPKGAMCEHGGMVNHLYAKIEDLGIRPGDVVAQTAPQCFDISLWQLVSALLVGGRTLIVGQDRILDVERFIDTVERGTVAVFQVVPSYLDAVVAYLAGKPRALPHLRCVSATGEALKRELVRRWFDVMPNVKLVNAYGLTETSDDTNHEVMSAPPAGGSVPLGRPIANVRIHILDERQRLVPLGAPGEIAFSGVCVGRGYINDPERTAQAYSTDPYVDGARLYRAGDYGRWSPDGKLEYLGRRDNQVKISGFRIEIGDIENALLRVPGVRDGAVVVGEGTVVGEGSGQSKFLVAFYSGNLPLEVDEIRSEMAARVPGYMVPSAYRWQESLPLTGNGKIDRKALTRMALEVVPEAGTAREALSATEQRLAEAWATVLGLPVGRIGGQDSFFALGGTSLSAVKLAVLLKRAVSIKDIMQMPILADLAALLEAPSLADAAVPPAPRPAGAVTEPDSMAPVGGPVGHSHQLPMKGKDL